ncbi:MAG TPA: spore maturation protein A [Ruminococcaceae bacterium]|nr:nucleoside recognition domain-containing protein [Oscillospiraceae bacterium]HCC02051.1 spore maturation protein A [Oscillospiraceae bacterium]HCM24054.1 spore maturation protein A [Oscillospiraceae bacterium]
MLNWIWAGMILISFICAVCTGRMEQLSSAVLSGAGSAVELCITTLGLMCFWTGLMHAAERGGLTQLLAKALSPLLHRLFPKLQHNSPALGAICMNLTANFLGLGNAATPLGLAAMQELKKESDVPAGTADNAMVLFVVLNTSSLQLIPTFMAALRGKYGAVQPFDILPAVWITSLCALLAAVTAAKLMERHFCE